MQFCTPRTSLLILGIAHVPREGLDLSIKISRFVVAWWVKTKAVAPADIISGTVGARAVDCAP